MSLLLDCREYCEKHGLLSCQAVIVGVSGGADSMCLLDILISLSGERMETPGSPAFPKIFAAHVNHGLRGGDAERDEKLVRDYCQKHGIPFLSRLYDIAGLAIEQGIGIEDAGRRARYAFFAEISKSYEAEGIVYTAVAHHREDQAETILMNLFRGTGPEGLCGMHPISRGIIRPLLFASKQDILKYAADRGVPYAEDASNRDNAYMRNRWRNQLLPMIGEVCGKDPVPPLLSMSELLCADQDYFGEIVADILEKHRVTGGNGDPGLPCAIVSGQHKAIASRLVRALYEASSAESADLAAAHVEAVLALARDPSGWRRGALAHAKIAYVLDGILYCGGLEGLEGNDIKGWRTDRGELMLCPGSVPECPFLSGEDAFPERFISISKTSFTVETILVENPNQVVYNSRTWYCTLDELRGACIRTRRTGDRFRRAGAPGGKPFRRFLTDRKVPSFIRDRMLLAAKGDEILWIPGLAHAAGFVDETSGRRFFESRGLAYDGSSVRKVNLCRITIIDKNEQEEHT